MNEKPHYTENQVRACLTALSGLYITREKALKELNRFHPVPHIRCPIDEEDEIIDSDWQERIDSRRDALGRLMADYVTYRDRIPEQFRNDEPIRVLLREILDIFN